MGVNKIGSFFGSLGKGFAGSAASSLGQGLMSAMFGGLANRRARNMYTFLKEQDLKYQKELSEYLTTNLSAWQKLSLRNAGLSTAGMEGSTSLAGTSLGSGNLLSQPIEAGQFALGEVAASLADAARADSQARLYDKQVNWYDRQAQTDLDLRSSQIGLNDESRRVLIALGEKYTAERLNTEAARAGILAQSELARDLIQSQIGSNNAQRDKLAKDAAIIQRQLETFDVRFRAEIDKLVADTKMSLAQAANLKAAIPLLAALAGYYGALEGLTKELINRFKQMTPLEVKKMVQDTNEVVQRIQNAKTDRDMTLAKVALLDLDKKYYVRNMRWNHASQAFGMFRDFGIGAGSIMSGAGSLMSGKGAMNSGSAMLNHYPESPVIFSAPNMPLK